MVKRILLIVIAVLVIIQFIRPTRNISTTESSNAIAKHYQVPDTINNMMKVACNDCHTNNTRYPWYTNIQPVGWWMQWHVNEGKKHVNYEEFASYAPKKQYKKMEETAELVKKDEMPLNSYLWIHHDAKLTAAQKDLFNNWATQLQEKIRKDNNIQPDEKNEPVGER
jgi:hypothetical protein